MTPAEQLDALTHGLMDYDSHENGMPLLHRPEVRDDALWAYREYVERYLLPRLQEAEMGAEA